MTAQPRLPCSDESLARAEQQYGTGSAGRAWLLLELCGAWGPAAFLQSPACVEPALGLAIVRRAEAAGMRIVAIRRPGRRPQQRRWRWFVATSDVGREALVGGEVDSPQDYLDLDLDGADGVPVSAPLVAVCAHGKHDQCCAVRGRAAAARIAAAHPEATWECSHLGGDRFAATMLILPEGLCYGRVDATDGAALVDLYREGKLDNRFLRGRTSVPHAVQAAQHFAREALGDNTIDAFAPLDVRADDGTTHITLAGAGGAVEVVLAESLSEPLFSQCRATSPGRVRTYALESLRAL